jgi:hypothetical protein
MNKNNIAPKEWNGETLNLNDPATNSEWVNQTFLKKQGIPTSFFRWFFYLVPKNHRNDYFGSFQITRTFADLLVGHRKFFEEIRKKQTAVRRTLFSRNSELGKINKLICTDEEADVLQGISLLKEMNIAEEGWVAVMTVKRLNFFCGHDHGWDRVVHALFEAAAFRPKFLTHLISNVQGSWGGLRLNGLKALSDKAAESLSKYSGTVSLNGLTTLSDAAAESLSKHKGHLSLCGLTTLSDAAVASLSRWEGDLFLYGLTALSDAAAESLSKHVGDLYLIGLTELSDEAAESLAKHNGQLSLDGLPTISEAVAKSLSNHQGSLSLLGLGALSDAAAKNLSRHKGKLTLQSKVKKTLISMRMKDGTMPMAPEMSDIYIVFNKLREELIGARLPLDPLIADERFLYRIRQDVDEFNKYLTLINEEIQDPHDRETIKTFFDTPIQHDWSINVCSENYCGILGSVDPFDYDAVGAAFESMGILSWSHCYENEESLYGNVGEGQKWMEQFFEMAGIKPSQLTQIVLYPNSCAEIARYQNEVGILITSPKIGDKWLDYKVVSREICDFFNRCLYPSHIVLFVSRKGCSSLWLGGTFVLVSSEKLVHFVEELAKCIPNRSTH